MRSEPSEVGSSKKGRARTLLAASREASRNAKLRRIALEKLEARTLLATQPLLAPIVDRSTTGLGVPADVSNPGGGERTSGGNESTPSIAVDPNNPQKLVAAWVHNDPSLTGTKIFVEAAYSNNGGQSWTSLPAVQQVLLDPTTSNPIIPFAQVTDPTVAFDRNDNAYILDSQHNGGNAAGTLALTKYSFSGGAPALTFVNNPVYQWIVDPALTPTLAVDDNVPTFTDPTNPSWTQNDPSSGNVYVAWATNDTPRTNESASVFNPNRILLTASSDGGNTFGTPVTVNANANSLVAGQFAKEQDTSPQIVISQGRPAGPQGPAVTGGAVTVVWDNFGTGASAGTPFDQIESSTINNGSAGLQFTSQFNGVTGAITDAIKGANSAPDTPQTTVFNIPVNITTSAFTSLSNLAVTLDLTHPALQELQIILVPPVGSGLQPFTLINNGVNAAGNNTGTGLTGANLGVTGSGLFVGTTLTDLAHRSINDQSAASPYTGDFQPENGSLNATYNGATAAQLNGTWQLQITDFRNGNVGTLRSVSIALTSGMTPGTNRLVATDARVRGAAVTAFPVAYPFPVPSSPQGVGPAISVASDNTLGAYSPHQGRIYVAFTDYNGPATNPNANTDIALYYSDNGGVSWNLMSTKVNDDLGVTDGFSGAGGTNGRTQLQPQVAVDNTTGTLVLSWLDARYDASNVRVADYVAYSIDGGQTFSPQAYANASQTAVDAITGQTEALGPLPENATVNSDATFGFGTRQGLAVAGGHVYPVFVDNLNGDTDGKRLADIWAARVTIPAGPRVISGSMGPITPTTAEDGSTVFNNLTAAAGTPEANGFEITFDRPVDPSTLTASDVQVLFHDTTANNTTGGLLPVTSVKPIATPTDPNNPNNVYGYTKFVVFFKPASQVFPSSDGVGTYSYVVGPSVADRIRTTAFVTTPVGTPQTFANNTAVPITNGATVSSTVNVSGFTASQFIDSVTVNLTVNYPQDFGLTLTLIAPDGRTITLAQAGGQTVGANFTNTTFDDNAAASINSGTAPFTGTFRPVQSLTGLNSATTNGTWTLQATSTPATGGTTTNQIVNWSLTIQAGTLTAGTKPGNAMDQNGNGTAGESVDTFAAPTPTTPTATAFTGPYQSDTLPMVVPGPHVVNSYVPGLNTSLAQDQMVNALDVVFDRNMDPTSVSAADVLRVMGPAGLVAGPYTMTPDPFGNPASPDPDPSHPRTFRVTFPTQSVSGTYTVTLASSIRSQAGDELDTNLNAGVDLVKGNPGTNPTTPVTYTAPVGLTPITALGTASATLNVPDSFTVQGLSVQLSATYPNDPDLTVTLKGPDGTQVILFSGVGTTGTHANFSNTTLTDTAGTSIQNGGPPFFGSFAPQQPLSAFNGKLSAGTWTLLIQDAGSSSGSLTGWSLTFQKAVPSSGLGELVADQATASFRIFNSSPTNPLASDTWTAVGPAPVTNSVTSSSFAGAVSTIAVDPSDPSGNTVYVGGPSGGVWKTTDFLTTNPAGPTYVPLTDFGPTGGLNIGSIAVFAHNSDPNQSIVIAGTGFGSASLDNAFGPTQGVGFLLSKDGGATWTLLDSTDNTLPAAQRDHIFAANGGTTTFKVVVDPNPTPNGGVIIYAAMSGPNGGLWRSIDTGMHWQKMSVDSVQGTSATDVVLDQASATVDANTNPTGNVNQIYAAFPGHGVYVSPNRGSVLNLMAGQGSDPQIRDGFVVPPPQISLANGGPFGGAASGGRIVLATPPLIPSTVPNADVENAIYQNWLYAAVANPNGHIDGLYLTKDGGATWTKLDFTHTPPPPPIIDDVALPTNDQTQPIYDVMGSPVFAHSQFDVSLAVDPANPNIVYLGGTSVGQTSGLIRIDASQVYDSHAMVAFDNNRNDGGASENNTAGRVALKKVTDGLPYVTSTLGTSYLNLIQNPATPFQVNTTVFLFNVASFSNDGTGLKWTPFDQILEAGPGTNPSTNVQQILTMVDPVTGLPRLIIADDQGVFTGVDNGGALETQIGAGTADGGTAVASFSRNGNLQTAQFFYGSAQPSDVAAQLAQALYYGNGVHTGTDTSSATVQTTANLGWNDPNDLATGFLLNGTVGPHGEVDGVGVGASQQAIASGPDAGQNIVYEYLYPGVGGDFSDFFLVSVNGSAFVSRTTGLIQTGGAVDPQWPLDPTTYADGIVQGNFAVNPIDGDEVIISSAAGRIFSTIDQGRNWQAIGDPTALDGSYAPALAYGAPDPNAPGGIGNLNNFIYAGTVSGHIFVTQTGGNGTQWTNISSGLDGSPVMKIITDPSRLSHAAYAVTANGVYYTPDSLANVGATGTVWTNITGNLTSILNTSFGLSGQALQSAKEAYLTSIQADWRYAIPNPGNAALSHPVLYVSGNSGVYRSLDNGATWSLFPSTAVDNAPVDGGYLPNAPVTDLTLDLGTIDPTTGRALQTTTVSGQTATAPDTLLATTFGRGSFQIRLAPIVFPDTASQPGVLFVDPSDTSGTASDGSTIVTNAQATIHGLSAQTAFGNNVLISLYDMTDPANPVFIGGFNPADPSTNTAANRTDTFGNFAIAINPNAFQSNGLHTIGVQATDGTGTKGNIATLPITLQASNIVSSGTPQKPTAALSPQSDSSGGQDITNVAEPVIVGVTSPGVTVQLFLSNGTNPTLAVSPPATSDSSGNYAIQFPTPLADGGWTIQVKATNPANPSLSSLSDAVVFTILTHGPSQAPSLSILPADDTGVVGDGITSARQPHLTGTVDPGAIVDLYNASNMTTPLSEVTANASSGAFSIQIPGPQSNGTISLVVQARDVANNKGPVSQPFNLTITTVAGDFNNSGKAQPAVFQRTSPGASWLIPGVAAAAGAPFGSGALDIPLLADFLGVGQDQLAVYRPSTATWYAAGAFPASGVQFGWAGVDEPVPADYFGTGRAGLAVYRPTTGQWFIAGMSAPIAFGGPGDIPVPGDYDNTGRAEEAVYRPSTGQFFIAGHAAPIQLGTPNEIPVPGQYDNTATSHATEPAVYNPTTGVMTILGPGGVTRTVNFTPGSIPAPGNYDGVAGDEPAAYDPTTGTLTIVGATTHTVNVGGPSSVPLEAPLGYRKPPVAGDFVGTGQAQLSLFRPGTQSQWFVAQTGPDASGQLAVTGVVDNGVPFGAGATDIPLLADFAGTGHDQLAVYRTSNSTWYAQGGLPNAGVPFGGPGDVPVPGNYDGTGKSEIAVYRPSTGQWFIQGHTSPIAFGGLGDIPVPGNYDGTGKTEIAVYRPSTGQWFIQSHTSPIAFGAANLDVPIPADYSSNGVTNIAVYRPTTGQWFILGNATPISFGAPGLDIPVAADFDGVNHAELGVYRPSTGQWFVFGHGNGVSFGGAGDIPAGAPLTYRVSALQSQIALSASPQSAQAVTASATASAQVVTASAQVVTASASSPPSSSPSKAATTTTTIASASSSTSRRPNQAATKGAGVTLHDVALSQLYGSLRRSRHKP